MLPPRSFVVLLLTVSTVAGAATLEPASAAAHAGTSSSAQPPRVVVQTTDGDGRELPATVRGAWAPRAGRTVEVHLDGRTARGTTTTVVASTPFARPAPIGRSVVYCVRDVADWSSADLTFRGTRAYRLVVRRGNRVIARERAFGPAFQRPTAVAPGAEETYTLTSRWSWVVHRGDRFELEVLVRLDGTLERYAQRVRVRPGTCEK